MNRIGRIHIGDFDMRVIFYTQNRGTVDDYGNPTLDLGTGVNRWAKVEYKQKSYITEQGCLEYVDEYKIKSLNFIN